MSNDKIWNSVFKNQEWGKYPSEDLIRFIARNFYSIKNRLDVKVLELGCGPGANIWFLAKEGFSFCGIDCSSTAIEQASLRLDKEFPNWRQHSELIVGNANDLPYASESFDAVIDNECICCLDFKTAIDTYNEAWRVTKYNGKLYSRTFSSGSWGDGCGEHTGYNRWICTEGPLTGKGQSRFTSLEDVFELVKNYNVDSIEKITRTENNMKNTVSEFLILCSKI
ncbi:MAG: hypothetical protein RIQ83_120 [Pseudomonadota bacterium]|jgi:ubiquinone/menaquinone biosynthesis C-methylase UbiE|uniref:class I SAM-dependent methyltransferase n=1 Tax=Aeromonas popoffii TaxID=70856 RepID=UPI00322ED429